MGAALDRQCAVHRTDDRGRPRARGGVGEGGAPRALLQDAEGARWLIGTDGSTARVYHMSVPREARTCREAHERIAGFPETRLIAEA